MDAVGSGSRTVDTRLYKHVVSSDEEALAAEQSLITSRQNIQNPPERDSCPACHKDV